METLRANATQIKFKQETEDQRKERMKQEPRTRGKERMKQEHKGTSARSLFLLSNGKINLKVYLP